MEWLFDKIGLLGIFAVVLFVYCLTRPPFVRTFFEWRRRRRAARMIRHHRQGAHKCFPEFNDCPGCRRASLRLMDDVETKNGG